MSDQPGQVIGHQAAHRVSKKDKERARREKTLLMLSITLAKARRLWGVFRVLPPLSGPLV